jgi:hypothetical protein
VCDMYTHQQIPHHLSCGLFSDLGWVNISDERIPRLLYEIRL